MFLSHYLLRGREKMKSSLLCLLVIWLKVIPSYAQPRVYSLKDCISILENNKDIQLGRKLVEREMFETIITKDTFLPNIAISSQQGLSFGRVLDPTTYDFVTNLTMHDISASIGGSVTLFSGLERLYQVKKSNLNLNYAELDLDRKKNNLTLEMTKVFLEILMDKEALGIYENKIDLLKKQEIMIARKVDNQTATTGDLLNVQADITRAQVEYSSAKNEWELDKVAICEMLEIDDWQTFDVSFDSWDNVEPHIWNIEDLLLDAQRLPQIRQKKVAVELAKRDVQIAASSYWPVLKINAGYGSTFSNARFRATGEEYMFFDQLRDNMNAYITVSLNIPLTSAMTVSHAIKERKKAVETSELELQRTLIAMDKEVKQTIVHVNTAYEKYQLLAKEVEKDTESLRQTEVKYNAGAATYFDYQIAVGNLFQAQAERLRARYEYIYWTKIMDYYSGKMSNPL